MSSSDRRSLLGLLAALPLAACGFSPAYAPNGAGQALRGQVRADDPSTPQEFDFVSAFEDRLGRSTTPQFRLSYAISTSSRSNARVGGMGNTRNSLFGTIRYQLRDLSTGDTVTSGELRNFTNFSSTDTQLATRRAQEDAQARLMRILADQVATRLLAAMAS